MNSGPSKRYPTVLKIAYARYMIQGFLPPACEVRGKVMYSVCPPQGGYPSLWSEVHSHPLDPCPFREGGRLSIVTGPVQSPIPGATQGEGYPNQDKTGGTSSWTGEGVPLPDRRVSDAMTWAVLSCGHTGGLSCFQGRLSTHAFHVNNYKNKKVLLRERKRHIARHVASARYTALSPGGDGEVPYPVLEGGIPHPRSGWGGGLHLFLVD